MFWNISRIYFFFFSIQNAKSNCNIIFLKIFAVIFLWWEIYSFPIVFIYKRFNFCFFFADLFLFLHDLTRLLQHIESSCCIFYWWDSLLLLSNQENLYMTLHKPNLFYDIYDTITEHNWRQTHYLSLVLNYFGIYF